MSKLISEGTRSSSAKIIKYKETRTLGRTMKKLVLSIAITSALGLTACEDTSLEDVQAENSQQKAEIKAQAVAEATTPRVRTVFDPSGGELSIPNDLLFSGTTDGTLEIPAEVAQKEAGDGVDFGNPEVALGALDGWGTQNSFTVALDFESEELAIDPTTLVPGAVSLYQVEKYPSLTDADCADPSKSGLLCKGLKELTFGVDFVATLSGKDIAIVPLKPFMAGASYVVSLTDGIKDTAGNALAPSSTYASVKADISTSPLVLPSIPDSELNATQAGIRLLQTMVNNFEDVLEADLGADASKITYTQAFTVQSAGVPASDPLQVVKKLNGQVFGQTAAVDASAVATVIAPVQVQVAADTFINLSVADALAAEGLISADPMDPTHLLYKSANLYSGKINVPYYLDEDMKALSGRWEAACDSGVMLQALSDDQKAALAAQAGDNQELCSQVGLADFGIDEYRHLTKYNPVPNAKSEQEINVQVTLPNPDVANMVRPSFGLSADLAKPMTGWPVVILQHGVTSKKEDMLAITGALSAMGFATVAIDHPLHGERGFELEDGTVINASSSVEGSNPTHYLNLASLLTARDNMRQSIADGLKLRLSLNAIVDGTNPTSAAIDGSKVHYFGHSLGGITGVGFTAVANSPTGVEELDALYKVSSAVLANPGAGVGNFLLESGAFGPLVKASVVAGLGNELTAALMAKLAPEEYMQIIAANPSCAAALDAEGNVVDQNVALVCAYEALMATATDEQKADIAASFASFSFAAQTAIDAADPTNYAQTLVATQTPVLMYEMVGDMDEGGMNPSDQVVPNSVSTNPIAGTSGLEAQMGLTKVTEQSLMTTEGSLQAIVEFRYGGHSTVLSPSTELEGKYPQLFAAVNQEAQAMAGTFFLSNGSLVSISDGGFGACLVKGANAETCSAE